MKFTIRIYGIYIQNKKLLITDEYRLGMFMTKLPGGGLEYGESTIDCLKREIREEMNMQIKDIKHFYTTDFFQTAIGIDKQIQLISIYYTFDFDEEKNITFETEKKEIQPIDGYQSFRMIDISTSNENEFTFPIDKHVFNLIKKNIQAL